MRYVVVLFSLIVGVGAGFYFGYDIGYEKAALLFEPKEEVAGEVIEKEWLTYKNDKLGFSVQYQTAPYGYVPIETEESDALFAISFYDEREWVEFLQSTEAREGPRAITVEVFDNTDGTTVREWVEAVEQSNYRLSPDQLIETVAVGAFEGVKYRWSGLYEAESVVFATDEHIYVLSGTYIAPDDRVLTDFRELVQTFSLVQ